MSTRTPTLPPIETFAIIYDLRDPDAWERSKLHRRYWGILYTDIHVLDEDHVLLAFRPAPDRRWREWEAARRGWILEGAA